MIYLISLGNNGLWYVLHNSQIKSSLCRFTHAKGHIFTCTKHFSSETKWASQHLQAQITGQAHLKNLIITAGSTCAGIQCNDLTSNAAKGPPRVHSNLLSTLRQYTDSNWFPAQGCISLSKYSAQKPFTQQLLSIPPVRSSKGAVFAPNSQSLLVHFLHEKRGFSVNHHQRSLLPNPPLSPDPAALSGGCTSLHTKNISSGTEPLPLQGSHFSCASQQLPEAGCPAKEQALHPF